MGKNDACRPAASSHIHHARKSRQLRFRRQDQPQTSPPVEKRFLIRRLQDVSAIYERDLVGNLLYIECVVRRGQHRSLFVRKHCHQPAQYLSPRDRIETGRRLVQHRQSWSASQRQQQRRFHPLSVRHPLDLLLCLQVEPPRKVVGVCTIPAWIDRPNEVDVPLDRCDPIDRKIRQGILTPRRIRCDLTAGVTLIEKLAL